MPLSLRERRGLCFGGKSYVPGEISIVKKKVMRISDFLEEDDDTENTKCSVPSPFSPSFLSCWFSSHRSPRDTRSLQSRLNACLNTKQVSSHSFYEEKRDNGGVNLTGKPVSVVCCNSDMCLVENDGDANVDATDNELQRIRETNKNVVSPDNAGLDSESLDAGGRERKFAKKSVSLLKNNSRKRAELTCRSLLGSLDATWKDESSPFPEGDGLGLLPGCSGNNSLAAKPISQDHKDQNSSSDIPGSISDSCVKASSAILPDTFSKQSEIVTSSGNYLEEVSFKFGLGVGLVFLIAKSKDEFNKMTELRSQMEVLLNKIQFEMQRKDVISIPSKKNCSIVCSSSVSQRNKSRNHSHACENHGPGCNLVEVRSSMESNRCCNIVTSEGSITTSGTARCQRMDQLEAELEVELERLQLNLERENSSEVETYLTENSSKVETHQRMEMGIENTAPAESLHTSFRDEDDPREAHSGEAYGISPFELERRLHELLETQQRERISELESALKRAERMLHEKEMEICWWKDNARLLSQH